MVPPSSNRISRVPPYLHRLLCMVFVYGAITLYCQAFQLVPLTHTKIINDWAPPISLAATFGISVDFFSSGYLDVSVPRVRFIILCIQIMMPASRQAGFPIRISLDSCARLSALQRFSQTSTSFFASDCLGIHRLRLYIVTGKQIGRAHV